MIDYSAIGRRIKTARLSCGMTQEKLAEQTGLSLPHISNIETGHTKLSLPTMVEIANALSVSYANPQAMTGREFEVIASVVLGGISLNGGKGSMLGTFLGVLVMSIISNVLILIGIQSYWQSFAQGVVLLIAVYIDGLRTGGNS